MSFFSLVFYQGNDLVRIINRLLLLTHSINSVWNILPIYGSFLPHPSNSGESGRCDITKKQGTARFTALGISILYKRWSGETRCIQHGINRCLGRIFFWIFVFNFVPFIVCQDLFCVIQD